MGAFATHGDINTTYGERGGSRFGYPITDEKTTPDGRGRFNNFRDAATRAERSIFWTPETGAHVVECLIRNRDAALGWERALKYPTSDEVPTHDNVGRFQ